jgi:hypothetical protein
VRVRALEKVETLLVVIRAASLLEQFETEIPVPGAVIGEKAVERTHACHDASNLCDASRKGSDQSSAL